MDDFLDSRNWRNSDDPPNDEPEWDDEIDFDGANDDDLEAPYLEDPDGRVTVADFEGHGTDPGHSGKWRPRSYLIPEEPDYSHDEYALLDPDSGFEYDVLG